MPLRICNIQDFTLHDGPGIRTTIFLSGCPLRCTWCHNPETQSLKNVLVFDKEKCSGCGLCAGCTNDVHNFENVHLISRENCDLCGKCIADCPSGALTFAHHELSDDEFFRIALRQKRIAGNNGGITFSGGEPLMQGEHILRLLKKVDIHTAIETCGYADEELFSDVVKKVDYVMFDIKLADDEKHKKYTGVSNKLILKNLESLRKCGTPYVLRTPLIDGITNTDENLYALSEIAGNDEWEKLEYNPLTPSKYEKIGRIYSPELRLL